MFKKREYIKEIILLEISGCEEIILFSNTENFMKKLPWRTEIDGQSSLNVLYGLRTVIYTKWTMIYMKWTVIYRQSGP